MQLFGLCDVSVELIKIGVSAGCIGWIFLGAITVCLPVGFLSYGLWRCRQIYREGGFQFNRFEHRDLRTIYKESMQAKGFSRKAMTLVVDIHDTRYAGDWGKKSEDAKRWGFFLGNTAATWFCFAFPLVKKLVTAVLVHLPDPAWSATMITGIYWVDLVLALWFRGHRDHLVNFSGVTPLVRGSD